MSDQHAAKQPEPVPQQLQPVTLRNGEQTLLTFYPNGVVEYGEGVKEAEPVAKHLMQALRVAYADKESRAVAADMRAVINAFGNDLVTVAGIVQNARRENILGIYGIGAVQMLTLILVFVIFWRQRAIVKANKVLGSK